ncbi:hypothetical protein J4573_53460, partial [Actinomadura barringtoniae]
LQNTAPATLALPALDVSAVDGLTRVAAARFDLDFSITEIEDDGRPAGLRGVLTGAMDLFAPATVDRIAERFVQVLTKAVEDPRRRIRALDVISADEHRNVVH